ncbi:MAG TPA: amidohydrolase family protein [Candidatus Binataceae bacterium]|jgi:predicted TIM-barrel fold metal-dependent hydrolase|nr:amidohydrolase family protein [Candidatus Binataceae bacterium]
MQYNFVSGDDHMDLSYIPARLWVERVPAKYRELAPRIEEVEGKRRWVSEGKPWDMGGYGTMDNPLLKGAIPRAGVKEEPEPGRFRPSTAKFRLEDMDRDGIDAQVIYGPPLPMHFKDRELQRSCLGAYNSWMAEFCSEAPQRLVGVAILPMNDPGEAVAELERVAKLGLRGALFGVFDACKPVFDEAWEPLWAAAADHGVVLSFHLSGGVRNARFDARRGQVAALVSALPMQLDEPLCEIIFCGALDAHPKLRLILAEAGLGWVPYLLGRMDHEYEKLFRNTVKLSAKPSELFRQHVWVSFEEDDVGLKLIPEIGEDNVVWASDYPHPDSTWPNSRKYVQEHMKGLSAAVIKKITCDNTVKLYNLG